MRVLGVPDSDGYLICRIDSTERLMRQSSTYARGDLPQDSGRDPICSIKGGLIPTTRTPLAIGIIPSRRDGGYVAERVL